jgi:uncharacterized protein (DUF4415 family)
MASRSDRATSGRTDWKRIDALTDDDIEKMAAADDENPASGAEHWASARIGLPPRKTRIHTSLDADVVHWFKQQGRGYQTRMNAVLRRYMDAHSKKAG